MTDLLAPEETLLPSGDPYVPWRDIPAFLTIKNKQAQRVPFHLNRMQRHYIERHSHRDTILKARQIGVSFVKVADYLMRTLLRGNISYAFVLDEDSKAENWRGIIDAWVKEDLPRWGIAPRIGRDNRTTLSFPGIGSEIHVFSARKWAPGRSTTYNILHLSEMAHFLDAEKTVTAIRPSIPPPPYGVIAQESTAYGVGNLFHRDWLAAKAAQADPRSAESIYRPHFYPWWWEDDAYQLVAPRWFRELSGLTNEELELHEREGLTYDQLYWRRITMTEMERAGQSFRQEYPEDEDSCFIGTGSKVFDREGVRYLYTLVRPPFKEMWDKALQVWEEPQVGHRYVIGADTSEGGLGDFHAAVVLDVQGVHHVATLRARDGVTPNQFARLLDDLGTMYRNRGQQAYLGVERRSSGYTVLSELEELKYDNLHSEIARVERRRPVYEPGLMISAGTKRPLVNELQEAVRTARLVTHDRVLMEEMTNYVQERESGVVKSHAAGRGNDDMVSAMMIALRMIEEAPPPRSERDTQPIDLLARRTG